jgi:hypothetical protein
MLHDACLPIPLNRLNALLPIPQLPGATPKLLASLQLHRGAPIDVADEDAAAMTVVISKSESASGDGMVIPRAMR